jgi:regulator of sigma D
MAQALAIRQRPTATSVVARGSHALLELLISKWRLQRIEVNRLLLQLLSGELLACPPADQAQSLQVLRTELVDYVSTGHFEIYGRVLPRRLRPDPDLHNLLQHIFHNIGQSTDTVLGFNDRFAQDGSASPTRPARQVLLRLSRVLHLRFALEEQLLDLCGH